MLDWRCFPGECCRSFPSLSFAAKVTRKTWLPCPNKAEFLAFISINAADQSVTNFNFVAPQELRPENDLHRQSHRLKQPFLACPFPQGPQFLLIPDPQGIPRLFPYHNPAKTQGSSTAGFLIGGGFPSSTIPHSGFSGCFLSITCRLNSPVPHMDLSPAQSSLSLGA